MSPGNHQAPKASTPPELELQPILLTTDSAGEPVRKSTGIMGRWEALKHSHPLAVAFGKNLALIWTWYCLSTSLSLWNKILVGEGRGLFGKGPFPAPMMMTSVQFIFQHFLARLCIWTGLVKRARTADSDDVPWGRWAKSVLPNGVATGLDIGFSNYSLVFISLSFYVMCKSTVPLFLLTFAIIWRIERLTWGLVGVVSVISLGLLLLVAGEVDFHLMGFILVMSASALAGLRWTITQVLLQGGGRAGHASSGGPVEVILQLTPIMSLTLGLVSLGVERLWVVLPDSPYFASPWHCLLTLLIMAAGGLIAFFMVWAEFALISNTSALTFMVAGTFKEIVTVAAAVLFLGERFTLINALGLLVLIIGVALFNWQKYRKLRERGLVVSVVSDEDEVVRDGENPEPLAAVGAGKSSPLGSTMGSGVIPPGLGPKAQLSSGVDRAGVPYYALDEADGEAPSPRLRPHKGTAAAAAAPGRRP